MVEGALLGFVKFKHDIMCNGVGDMRHGILPPFRIGDKLSIWADAEDTFTEMKDFTRAGDLFEESVDTAVFAGAQRWVVERFGRFGFRVHHNFTSFWIKYKFRKTSCNIIAYYMLYWE